MFSAGSEALRPGIDEEIVKPVVVDVPPLRKEPARHARAPAREAQTKKESLPRPIDALVGVKIIQGLKLHSPNRFLLAIAVQNLWLANHNGAGAAIDEVTGGDASDYLDHKDEKVQGDG
nr:unnamed protein product [Digitaria exilis]